MLTCPIISIDGTVDWKINAAKLAQYYRTIFLYKPLDLTVYAKWNIKRFNEAKYRRTQHNRVMKYVHRGLYLEAYAYYNRYALEPLIDLLRLIHTPASANYYLVHISHHVPSDERERLEYFAKISTLDEIAEKTSEAGDWFYELVERVQI